MPQAGRGLIIILIIIILGFSCSNDNTLTLYNTNNQQIKNIDERERQKAGARAITVNEWRNQFSLSTTFRVPLHACQSFDSNILRCSDVWSYTSDNVDYTRFHQYHAALATECYSMRGVERSRRRQTDYCLQWKHNEVYHKEQMNSKLTEATSNTMSLRNSLQHAA